MNEACPAALHNFQVIDLLIKRIDSYTVSFKEYAAPPRYNETNDHTACIRQME